ncbi:TIGR02391 family protein [Paraflavitalea pollutisoli]|uniref:TIGR02391 family protein n=1 Tax=Paraflavitalea pollutisoli TaxID=3034143 RepID=UPI0023EB9C26|nr:TIGR02391 family protein [Paraflavitalea sp. H1-2-19X]
MLNWKHIVTKLSEEYRSPGYGFWTEEHLRRSWKITFDFPPSRFHDPNDMHGNFATLFDFLATIANLDDVTDQEKIEKMVILLENIVGKIDITTINKILVKGGYDVPLPEPDDSLASTSVNSMHQQVVANCAKFFKQGHYFTCVNEACKAYNKAVQQKSGSDKDGNELMFAVLGNKGKLRFNAGNTETEKNELEGFQFMSAGIMKMFRNPTSHETALSGKINKQECLEILGIISYMFRQLDKSMFIS